MSIPEFIKRSLISQFIICLIFVVSGLVVCTLQTFTIVLWPVNKKLYRILNCKLVYLHWAQVVFLCDYWAEVELHMHLPPDVWPNVGKEHALMVMNHRNDLDWIVTWMIGDRAHFLESCKSVVKNESRYIPLIGWSFFLLEYIFVKRDFTKDRENLIKGFRAYGKYPLNSVTLLFCEGTRYTEAKHEKSNAFARKQGLAPLKHHLMPRTKGFTTAIEGFKGAVPAMYNCCVGYDTVRGAEPTLYNILQGKKMVFHLLGKRVLIDDIPNTEKECADYCYGLYKKKDEEYDYFLKHNTFAGYDKSTSDKVIPRSIRPLLVEIVWLLILALPSLYYMAKILVNGSPWARVSIGVVVLTICVLVRIIIMFTVTAKGSSYGDKMQHKHNDGVCPNISQQQTENIIPTVESAVDKKDA